MKVGSLSMAQLGADAPSEFRYCSRCDNSMGPKRAGTKCEDCTGVENFKERGRGRMLQAVDPGYEVALHYPVYPNRCPTFTLLDDLKIPRMVYTAKKDPLEVAYAESLFDFDPGAGDYPLVLILSHGVPVDWWSGHNPQALQDMVAGREDTVAA